MPDRQRFDDRYDPDQYEDDRPTRAEAEADAHDDEEPF